MMDRRKFLKLTGLAGTSLMLPGIISHLYGVHARPKRKLLLLELSGGNDGLNTLIPFRQDAYYRNRPTIALKRGELLALTDDYGLHPSLEGLKRLYDEGSVCLLNRVGYPDPQRSHYRSLRIWHTADVTGVSATGWLGRYQDRGGAVFQPDACSSPSVRGSRASGISLSAARPKAAGTYPDTQLGLHLRQAAQDILSATPPEVCFITQGGYDTHVSQKESQGRLLRDLDEAVTAFVADMKRNGQFEEVLLVAYSEFGRSLAENEFGGSDHGTANLAFVIGGGLNRPGIYNPLPDLDLCANGVPEHEIDFRQLYATLLDRWLETDSLPILGERFLPLRFI